jgi:hypothetical protein
MIDTFLLLYLFLVDGSLSNMHILNMPSEIIDEILTYSKSLISIMWLSFTCRSLNDLITPKLPSLILYIFKTNTRNKRLLENINDIEGMKYNLISRSMKGVNIRYMNELDKKTPGFVDAINDLHYMICDYTFVIEDTMKIDKWTCALFKDQVKLIKDNYMEEFNKLLRYIILYHKYYNEYSMDLIFNIKRINDMITLAQNKDCDISFFTDLLSTLSTVKLIKL